MTKGGEGLANAEITEKCLKLLGFLSNSSGYINNFCQIRYFLPKKRLFRKKVALNMFTKLTQKKKGGLANADSADKGGRGGWGKC